MGIPRNLWKKYHCVNGHSFSAPPKISITKCAICDAPLKRANNASRGLAGMLAKLFKGSKPARR